MNYEINRGDEVLTTPVFGSDFVRIVCHFGRREKVSGSTRYMGSTGDNVGFTGCCASVRY